MLRLGASDQLKGSFTHADVQRLEYFTRAFSGPTQVDMPVITFAATRSSASNILSATQVREKRIDHVATKPCGLDGDTHFRYDGAPALDPYRANPNLFVQAGLLPGGGEGGQSATWLYCVETPTDNDNDVLEFSFRLAQPPIRYRVFVNG